MCLIHFLDEAFARTDQALDRCRRGIPMKSADLEWLLTDALAVVKNLEEGADTPNAEQRDRMLEIEQEGQSARPLHRQPPAMAVVEI